MEFGELKRMKLRQAWKHEANDFTPWLARPENLQRLGEAVGIEMELQRTEVGAGPFFADMLAVDTLTERRIVIENQFDRTDHDHLGKSLTYAAVLDAATVIWIADRFTDEHLRALEWLNDHTSDEISFYGVQVELWRIGESLPAVRFNVVSRPNEAVRQTKTKIDTGELSESKRQQLDFWTKFSEKLRATGKVPSVGKPRPRRHFDVSLGKSGINIANICNKLNRFVSVRVYIARKCASVLTYFESRKEEIEQQLNEKLIWNPYV